MVAPTARAVAEDGRPVTHTSFMLWVTRFTIHQHPDHLWDDALVDAASGKKIRVGLRPAWI